MPVTRLSAAQQQRLLETYGEWLAIGRNCEPLDRTAAVEVVTEFYRRINEPAPAVLFFSSPAMCIMAYGALRAVGAKYKLWDQLGSQLRDQLGSQLRDQLGSQLWGQLWGQLRDQLGSQLRGQLRDQLWGQLRDQLWGQLGSQLNNYFAGAHWCYWEVFYDFCNEIGVKYHPQNLELLKLWVKQSRELHWWFPYKGVVLVSERPVRCQVDNRGRLHSADGAACGYSDGWGVWAWHGTRVPRDVIESPSTITPVAILAEQNAEVRRVMMERYGIDRFVLDAGASRLDTDGDNELLSVDLPGDPDGRLVALKLRCPSTSAVYILRVPPDQTKVRSAIAWTFGMSAEEYALEQEA